MRLILFSLLFLLISGCSTIKTETVAVLVDCPRIAIPKENTTIVEYDKPSFKEGDRLSDLVLYVSYLLDVVEFANYKIESSKIYMEKNEELLMYCKEEYEKNFNQKTK